MECRRHKIQVSGLLHIVSFGIYYFIAYTAEEGEETGSGDDSSDSREDETPTDTTKLARSKEKATSPEKQMKPTEDNLLGEEADKVIIPYAVLSSAKPIIPEWKEDIHYSQDDY